MTAAILLERGHLDTRDASPDWELIVHRDIKLGNGKDCASQSWSAWCNSAKHVDAVFLGDNEGDAFCGFPTAKVRETNSIASPESLTALTGW